MRCGEGEKICAAVSLSQKGRLSPRRPVTFPDRVGVANADYKIPVLGSQNQFPALAGSISE